MLVADFTDREHIDSLGSRTDLLGRTPISDVGISVGVILLKRVLHGVLVRGSFQT